MFYTNNDFADQTQNRGNRGRTGNQKAQKTQITNSTALAEGEGVTATLWGQRPSRGGKLYTPGLKLIHRVPSVEGATATLWVNLNVNIIFEIINTKKRSDELSLCNINKTKGDRHGA